jgi:hypothetical protein
MRISKKSHRAAGTEISQFEDAIDSRRSAEKSPKRGFNTGAARLVDARDGVRLVNRIADP